MQIQTSKFSSHSSTLRRSAPKVEAEATNETPQDSFTFRMSRGSKRTLMAAGTALVGAGIGSVAVANFTSSLSGTAAKVAGGVGGGVVGAVGLGIAGIAVAGMTSDGSDGLGGIGRALGIGAIAGAVGAVGGAVGGAMLGTGGSNFVGYAAGAIAGGVVGGFAAKGFLGD